MRIQTLKWALAALALSLSATANAAGPEAQIKETLDRVLAVTATFHSQQDFIDAKPKLREIILPRFDFAEMARRSLGDYWGGLHEKEQDFVAAFVDFAERSYTNALGTYRGEKMIYERETIDGNYAQVDSKIIDRKGQNYSVVYRLHRVDGRWRIYDVVAENISLVNNYRSQFNRVIAKSSFEELIRIMKQQAS